MSRRECVVDADFGRRWSSDERQAFCPTSIAARCPSALMFPHYYFKIIYYYCAATIETLCIYSKLSCEFIVISQGFQPGIIYKNLGF